MATSALLTPVGYVRLRERKYYLRRIRLDSPTGAGAKRRDAGCSLALPVNLSPQPEPIAHTSAAAESLNQRGDATAGVQVVMLPGHGIKPTISSSYLHLVRMGTTSSLNIGGFANSALLLASSDLGRSACRCECVSK